MKKLIWGKENEREKEEIGETRGRVCVKHINTLAHCLAWREAGGLWGDELESCRCVCVRERE